MNIRDLHIIDVDSHITEPADLWTRRAPAKYADRVPHVVDVDGVPMWSFDGVLLDNRRVNLSSVIRPTARRCPGPAFFDFEHDEIHPASSDMQARLEFLDDQGIYAQVLYPNVAGFGAQKFGEVDGPRAPPALRHALQRRDGRDPGGVGRSPAPDGAHAVVGRRGVGRRGAPHRGRRPARREHLQRPAGARRARAVAAGVGPVLGGVRRARAVGELPHRRERDVDELVRHVAVAVARRRAQARDRLGDDVPVERAHPRQPHLLRRARAATPT